MKLNSNVLHISFWIFPPLADWRSASIQTYFLILIRYFPLKSKFEPGTEMVLLFRVWIEVWLALDHSFFWLKRILPESSAKNLKPGMAENIVIISLLKLLNFTKNWKWLKWLKSFFPISFCNLENFKFSLKPVDSRHEDSNFDPKWKQLKLKLF